ncbi:hypothetical protein O181_065252 [Austropuccinia psidii MF-1]|uniref:Uncharacterized protein n=1 Tax=Austropuccinia psidii MF-1 TaxID=1389203 RepID=A0A9Q3I345_9BASI|nr:hypothetical protein [Austropuccinia psidii MF-1]
MRISSKVYTAPLQAARRALFCSPRGFIKELGSVFRSLQPYLPLIVTIMFSTDLAFQKHTALILIVAYQALFATAINLDPEIHPPHLPPLRGAEATCSVAYSQLNTPDGTITRELQ